MAYHTILQSLAITQLSAIAIVVSCVDRCDTSTPAPAQMQIDYKQINYRNWLVLFLSGRCNASRGHQECFFAPLLIATVLIWPIHLTHQVTSGVGNYKACVCNVAAKPQREKA